MRVLLVALVALAACSSDPAPPRACTPGAQVSCACPGGAAGVQVCAADGSGLGACSCPDAGGDAAPETAVDAPSVAPDAADAPSPPTDAPAPAEAAVDVAPEASGPCVDLDGDGYGSGCAAGPDCDDTNREIHPGAMELCDGLDDNCDGRNDGDAADGGVDPLAQAHCVAIWPYGADAAVPTRCTRPFTRLPCGPTDGFSCVACREVGDCFRQTQRPGQTYDIRACR